VFGGLLDLLQLVVNSETPVPTPAAAAATLSPYVLSTSGRTIAGGLVF